MKRSAVVLTAVLIGLMGQAASAGPSVYLRLKANGTDVPGDSPVASLGRADTIQCLAFNMGVTTPRAPSGLLTGRRQYEPVVITKAIDRSSVLLLRALTSNEVCECEFRFFRTGAGGDQHIYTVTLGDAYVSSIRQRVLEEDAAKGTAPAPVIEEVSFGFDTITWTWVDGGIENGDSVHGEAAAGGTGGAANTEPAPVVKPGTLRSVPGRAIKPKPEQ
jgi:type VI secretion system secreted protein Hcp